MTITLPSRYQQLVEQLVGQGGYQSPDDVVCDSLELLRAHTAYRQHRLEQMREEVNVGLEQMRNGEVVPFDPMQILEEVEQEFEDSKSHPVK